MHPKLPHSDPSYLAQGSPKATAEHFTLALPLLTALNVSRLSMLCILNFSFKAAHPPSSSLPSKTPPNCPLSHYFPPQAYSPSGQTGPSPVLLSTVHLLLLRSHLSPSTYSFPSLNASSLVSQKCLYLDFFFFSPVLQKSIIELFTHNPLCSLIPAATDLNIYTTLIA